MRLRRGRPPKLAYLIGIIAGYLYSGNNEVDFTGTSD